MPKAVLHIIIGNGAFTQQMDIDLPDDRINLDWTENARLREVYMEIQQDKMKSMYYKQLIKCQHQCQFFITCKSHILTKRNGVRDEIGKYLLTYPALSKKPGKKSKKNGPEY